MARNGTTLGLIANNCTVFQNSIQKALKERRLKLARKGDILADNYPYGLSINMVSVSVP